MRLLSLSYISLATALAVAFLATPRAEPQPAVDPDVIARLDALIDRVDKLKPDEPPAKPKPTRDRLDPTRRYVVDIEGAPARGPADAPITIVEFVDYQCPFCKRAQNTLKQIEEAYPGKVRVVFKHNPLVFHKRAEPASVAAECAREQRGDLGFWQMDELLWTASRHITDDEISGFARQLELNHSAFDKCLTQGDMKARYKADQKQAAKLLARGTPTFFVNGFPVVGAQPFSKFKEVIDGEL